MIRTGIANVRPLLDGKIYQKYYEKVPLWRQEKADRLRNPADQALSIGVWILYEMLRSEWNVSEKAAYNLSHSGKYVLCTLDTSETAGIKVGCDIEKPGETKEQIAGRFFTAAECTYIRDGKNETEKNTRFYRLWVLKESYVKAVERGMGLGLHNFEIGFTAENTPVLRNELTDEEQNYYFKEYEHDPEAGRIAVCSTCPAFAGEIFIETFS